MNSNDSNDHGKNELVRNEHGRSAILARQQTLQDAAERAEREGLPSGDPDIDAYRLVLRGVRQASMPDIPADFAQVMVGRLQARQRSEQLERSLTHALIGLLAITGAVLGLPPTLSAVMGVIRENANPALQWPLILSAGLALAVVWAVDRVWTLRSPHR